MLTITKSNMISRDGKNLYLIEDENDNYLGYIWAAKIIHPATNQTGFYTNTEDKLYSTAIYGVYKEK
jgi:hypothetical protein